MRFERREREIYFRFMGLDKTNFGRYTAVKKPLMKRETQEPLIQLTDSLRLRHREWLMLLTIFAIFASPSRAHASLFHGETLDAIANGISWVVLIIAPIIGIAAFWLVHILPEKIAHRKKHPQTRAIQCLCLLSLCFGGLLWPLAWLWAYTKPVLHRMAYGTDVDESLAHTDHELENEKDEIAKLKARIAELEAKKQGI
jgi:CBS domain containing-hemolysin-like protein